GPLWTAPYQESLPALGRRKWTILGQIARADPTALGLVAVQPATPAEDVWLRELDHWEGVLDADETEPLPVIRAAIRWLRANPPPPAQKVAVVHGDYRTGNFLYDTQGGIHGVLDWEMCHLGDPLEDLGWSFNPVWYFGQGKPGGLLPRDEAVAAWEAASGLTAAPDALKWWELFACVKGQAIWVSSARTWLDGANRDPILVYPAWALIDAQDRAALKVMGHL
ncbi:MAG: phosphotransferase family protein, partial [Phenylobacterium sp.]|nr:phosphotransferase family protein [Phenylobacterium sp.]